MSKICSNPKCGYANEDDHVFCRHCGEPLDAELQLIMNTSKATDSAKQEKAPEPESSPLPNNRYDDDDFQVNQMETKKSPAPWVALGIGVVILVILLIVLL